MLAAIAIAFPRCPVAAHLHLDCPGCGTTRALLAVARGDVGTAFDHNAFAMLALPVVITAFVFWLQPRWRPSWVARLAAHPATPRLVLAAVVMFTVVRNTPLLGGYLASS